MSALSLSTPTLVRTPPRLRLPTPPLFTRITTMEFWNQHKRTIMYAATLVFALIVLGCEAGACLLDDCAMGIATSLVTLLFCLVALGFTMAKKMGSLNIAPNDQKVVDTVSLVVYGTYSLLWFVVFCITCGRIAGNCANPGQTPCSPIESPSNLNAAAGKLSVIIHTMRLYVKVTATVGRAAKNHVYSAMTRLSHRPQVLLFHHPSFFSSSLPSAVRRLLSAPAFGFFSWFAWMYLTFLGYQTYRGAGAEPSYYEAFAEGQSIDAGHGDYQAPAGYNDSGEGAGGEISTTL